jgi:CheY-like chemotaxis protein
LLGLVDDVLDLANIESGRGGLSLEKVKISTMLSDCCMSLTPLLNQNLTLPEKMPWRVKADHIRLKQVLSFLLSNAKRHSLNGSSIEIICQEIEDNWLRISIKDTGASVTQVGIGLDTAKKLTELMGGRFGFACNNGGGNNFWVDLQLTEAREDQYIKESAPSQERPDAGLILYIEDNLVNLELMEMMIGRIDGLSLISTTTAENGIELAKQKQPNLILLDINLPGMSGNEAAEILRALPETSHIPLVALSAAATPADIERGLSAGFATYLTKPIRLETLTKVLSEVLGEK